jgi:hypothetical protein
MFCDFPRVRDLPIVSVSRPLGLRATTSVLALLPALH